MKLVQLLLALYVVMLSALPCEALCREESVPFSAQTAAPTSDECQDDEWCSPFCLCATCPGFAVPAPFVLTAGIVSINPPSSEQLPTYLAPHRLDVLGSIWQPPRLA